jgi:hypothetical protein
MEFTFPEVKSYKDVALYDQARAIFLVLKCQGTIRSQIRIAGDQGDLCLDAQMPKTAAETTEFFAKLKTFMAWRSATAFIWTSFVENPLGLYTCVTARNERHVCFRPFSYEPKPLTEANFGPPRWLPEEAINAHLEGLLPTEPVPLTPKEIQALEPWFGRTGRYPAWHVKKHEFVGI